MLADACSIPKEFSNPKSSQNFLTTSSPGCERLTTRERIHVQLHHFASASGTGRAGRAGSSGSSCWAGAGARAVMALGASHDLRFDCGDDMWQHVATCGNQSQKTQKRLRKGNLTKIYLEHVLRPFSITDGEWYQHSRVANQKT